MKQLEAFTMGKKFGHPELNEDSFVIIPNQGYAVIDGVTDRNGTRYDGMLSGQFASRTIKRAVEKFIIAQSDPAAPAGLRYRGPSGFIDYLTESLRQGYVENGALEAATADWKVRAGCTVMAALVIGNQLEVIAVGDSGIRINGQDILQVLKPLDDVTAILRRETWHYFAALGHDWSYCDDQAAAVTWLGTANQKAGTPTAHPEVIAAIKERTVAACAAHFSGKLDVPDGEVMVLIEQGIANGQGDFQGATDRVLGYGSLDGFPVPETYIDARSYDLGAIDTIELFTDGYFKIADNFGVAAWEAGFDEVERVDPHKTGPYFSTKGTTAAALTDDRTYVGIRLK